LPPCCHDTAPRSVLLKRGIHQSISSSIDAGSSRPVSWNRSSSCRAHIEDAEGRLLGQGAGGPAATRFGADRSIQSEAAAIDADLPPTALTQASAGVGLAGIVASGSGKPIEIEREGPADRRGLLFECFAIGRPRSAQDAYLRLEDINSPIGHEVRSSSNTCQDSSRGIAWVPPASPPSNLVIGGSRAPAPSGIVFDKGAVRPAVPAAAAVRPQQWNHRWIKEDSTEAPMISVHGFIRCFFDHAWA
jgi:hypothetical protein